MPSEAWFGIVCDPVVEAVLETGNNVGSGPATLSESGECAVECDEVCDEDTDVGAIGLLVIDEPFWEGCDEVKLEAFS